jgi:hypothetical protein
MYDSKYSGMKEHFMRDDKYSNLVPRTAYSDTHIGIGLFSSRKLGPTITRRIKLPPLQFVSVHSEIMWRYNLYITQRR